MTAEVQPERHQTEVVTEVRQPVTSEMRVEVRHPEQPEYSSLEAPPTVAEPAPRPSLAEKNEQPAQMQLASKPQPEPLNLDRALQESGLQMVKPGIPHRGNWRRTRSSHRSSGSGIGRLLN